MNLISELKKHPRPLWVLFFATLVNRFGLMVLPFFALYLTQVLDYSKSRAGMLIGVYGAGGLFINFFGSSLGDRFGVGRVITISLVGCGLILFVMPYIGGYYPLLATILVWSFFSGMVGTLSFAAVGKYSSPALLKSAFAIQRLAINIGASFGPIIGGFLAHDHFTWLFFIDGGTAWLAALLLYLYFPKDEAAGTATEHDAKPGSLLTAAFRALADRRLVAVCVVLLPIIICYTQLESSFPLFVVTELHHSERFYGFLFGVNTVVVALFEVPLTIKMQDTSTRTAVSLGGVCFAVGLAMFALGHAAALILGILLFTLGEMIVLPSSSAYISELAPEGRQSAYMGIQFATWSLAAIVGPMAGTWIQSTFGSVQLWLGLIAFALLTTVAARVLLRR